MPSTMSRKASTSIAERKMEKSVGANTQPCLTPFVTLNDSETSPPTLTYAIIPVCRASIIVVTFSGHPFFLSSCHSPVLPTVSNVLRRKNISTMLRLPLKPHSVSGTTADVISVNSLLRRICKEERLLYSSHSLFDHLSCRWLQC